MEVGSTLWRSGQNLRVTSPSSCGAGLGGVNARGKEEGEGSGKNVESESRKRGLGTERPVCGELQNLGRATPGEKV